MASDPGDIARAELEAWRSEAAGDRLTGDPLLAGLLRRYLGDRFGDVERRLQALAERLGPTVSTDVEESNRDENLPRLRPADANGRDVQKVVFHPAYHRVGEVFWSSGVLSILADPGTHVASGALSYLLDQEGEAGHACPVACTAGAIRLIQRLGTDDQRARYLPGLLESDYTRRLHAAQFVTEIHGGSDVGRNRCRAEPEPSRPGWYRIHGEKWFCSVADAGLFVVSARVGKAEGTRGLGLFLVPRNFDGRPNGFRLRRLKSKLGTRSMATGEIDFDGALGEAIGPEDAGFRNLVEIVLDTSRVHNALASTGLMRRAYVEARAFARHRSAFGRKIVDFPAIRDTLAGMRLRATTALVSTFRLLDQSDRLEREGSNSELRAARRIGVMLNKLWTSRRATETVRDGIEVLGGNGTIEDFSVLPRLYRDAIVLESWEGTHNTLCAQVLRDFAERQLHEPWLATLGREIDAVTADELRDAVSEARRLHEQVRARIERMLAADAETASAMIRSTADAMCRLTDLVALVGQADWELAHALPAVEVGPDGVGEERREALTVLVEALREA